MRIAYYVGSPNIIRVIKSRRKKREELAMYVWRKIMHSLQDSKREDSS
jgi:hypothetical protein